MTPVLIAAAVSCFLGADIEPCDGCRACPETSAGESEDAMVTTRKPGESDAEYLARLAADDGAKKHTVALALVVDGKFVETHVFDENPASVTIERTPNGIVAVDADSEAPLRAWRIVFRSGHDYLRDLKPYGFNTPAKVAKAAPAAWARLGAEYMATWQKPGHPYAPEWPWACEQFGKPPATD